MQKVIEHFKTITQIPHCSFETEQLRDFLVQTVESYGAKVCVDHAGNIHAYKGNPKVCLQSHYDMVCMGEAPKIEWIEKDGYLGTKNSSLGADNGIGVSIMLEALARFDHVECLFTDNEEVGLLGANGLEHKLKAKKFLNLDHECDQDVSIGCAGGVDITALGSYEEIEKEAEVYEVEVFGFKGGHSGVDILKNPTSSIKTLAAFIAQNQGEVIEFCGGERINSIPKFAKAKVIFSTTPKEANQIKFQALGRQKVKVCAKSAMFLSAINGFSHGLRSFNPTLGIAQTSINLAIAKLIQGEMKFELFARSNDTQELHSILFETLEFFKFFGYEVDYRNFYLPWESKENAFSEEVLNAMRVYNPKVQYYAIHAGIECGIISSKQEGLECCSIGPNIYNPHSVDERCELESVERISKVVFDILENNQ